MRPRSRRRVPLPEGMESRVARDVAQRQNGATVGLTQHGVTVPTPAPTVSTLTTTVSAPTSATTTTAGASSSSMSTGAAIGLGLGMIFLAVLIVAAIVLFYRRRRRRVRGARVDPYAMASEETPMTNLRPRTSILKRPGAGAGVFSSVNDGTTVMGGRGWVRLDNQDNESFDYYDPHEHDAIPPRYDSHEVAGSFSFAGPSASTSASANMGGGGAARANSGEISTGASSGSRGGARPSETPGEADATAFRVLGRGQGPRTSGFRVVGRDQGTRHASDGGQEGVAGQGNASSTMVLPPITAGREWSPGQAAQSPSSPPAQSPGAAQAPTHPQSRMQSLRQMKSDLHRYDTFGRPRKETDTLFDDEADHTTETGETSTAESGIVVTGVRGRVGVAVTSASSQAGHSKHTAAGHAGSGTRVSR